MTLEAEKVVLSGERLPAQSRGYVARGRSRPRGPKLVGVFRRRRGSAFEGGP